MADATVTAGKPGAVGNVKAQASRTQNELLELKNSKVPSTKTTVTGQPLTPYHSLLYSLLSWEQPRATAVSYASVVAFILAARFLPLLRWVFKLLYLALGFTAAAEIAGRVVLSQSIASSFRPRRYYTVPKETVEAVLEDVEQLLDFFLLEFQRILFAENVIHTVAAFSAAFIAYFLVKFLPLWGLSLLSATIIYIGPLIYISNRELIDAQIESAQEALHEQANQLKELAGQRTSHAKGLVKQRLGDYSTKAQEYINHRRSLSSTQMTKVASPAVAQPKVEPAIKTEDFPVAPKTEPVAAPSAETESTQKPAAEPIAA
ncbi:hypothetical protein MAP00_008605 [Monascus purpureus]|nr:hypothetical protein MAP00_008605 [Monascus purpureus]